MLAAAGVDSRRNCEALIADGRVKVNGKVITEVPFHVNPTKDKILVDGIGIQTVQPSKYFMLHKPKGYVCSAVQQPGLMAKPVVSLLKPWLQEWRKGKPINAPEPRFFTVGRLDVNTTGLMLVTNDGQWAQKVSHPATGASAAACNASPAAQQLMLPVVMLAACGFRLDMVHFLCVVDKQVRSNLRLETVHTRLQKCTRST